VYRLRRLLEADLAGRSLKELTDDGFARMRQAVEIYYEPSPNPDDVLVQHHEFHLALLEPAASEWDMRILEQLWSVSERYVRLVFGPVLLDHGRAESLGHAHDELIEVAQAGSADALRRAVRKHLDANEATIVAAIAEVGGH